MESAARMTEENFEQDLLADCKSGNRKAFEILYRRHQRRVFSVVLNFFGGERAAAEDVTVVAPRTPAAPAEPASDWNFDEAERAPASHDDGQDLGEFNDDPVDTKLDLARAYVDMGDAEGARAMLGEVMKEGSQMQRDVAKRLLDSLH